MSNIPLTDEIIRTNVLIAEFMGIETKQKNLYRNPPFHSGMAFKAIALEYHKSWDWLMPVVVKCHNVEKEKQEQFPEYKECNDKSGWRYWSHEHVHLNTDISRVYVAVVKFIKSATTDYNAFDQITV